MDGSAKSEGYEGYLTGAMELQIAAAGDDALLVDPTDVGAIAEALSSVLADGAMAARLAAAGRVRAAAYPWSRTAEGLVDVYREVVR